MVQAEGAILLAKGLTLWAPALLSSWFLWTSPWWELDMSYEDQWWALGLGPGL